jgi:hypothetical protein
LIRNGFTKCSSYRDSGKPCSGKTTILRYLAQRTAALADGPLPIVVSLHQYRFHLIEKPDLSLYDFALTQTAQGDLDLYATLERIQRRIWLLDDLDAFSLSSIR